MSFTVKQNLKTKMFEVHDSQSKIVVHCENGNTYQGTFVAAFKTKVEAEKFADRMNLRNAWGV